MRLTNTLPACAVALQVAHAAIAPDYHSLMWKFQDDHFWAPLGLNTSTYALESVAGSAPEALHKRDESGFKGMQYVPCTVMTVDSTLSAESLTDILGSYKALQDDVWSQEQVFLPFNVANHKTHKISVHGMPSHSVVRKCIYG